jgi:hypothetical protein
LQGAGASGDPSSLNYRVLREENGDYTIREVIYDDDGAVLGCTADPVEPYGHRSKTLRVSWSGLRKPWRYPS